MRKVGGLFRTGDDGDGYVGERPGVRDLPHRLGDELDLRERVPAEDAPGMSDDSLDHSRQRRTKRRERLHIIRVRRFNEDHATHLLRMKPREQIRVQAAK